MNARHPRSWISTGLALTLALLGVGVFSSARSQPGRAVPAIFEQSIQLPGEGDRIQRPSALFFDAAQGEIFVGDSSRNRIVIFSQNGTYRYEFSGLDRFALPLDLVVDSQGQILILGSTREGARLFRYDFDGLFLHEVDTSQIDGARMTDLAIDESDNLFVAQQNQRKIFILRDDRIESVIDVAPLLEGVPENEAIFGQMEAADGRIYLPLSTVGSVVVIDLETGQQVGSIGFRGENPGELVFPVAVSLPNPGMITVLDKMRFAVVCYDPRGRFLGEFGGKGQRDGWFYHPHLLSPAGNERMIIGQIFENRVQVCRIPDFILDAVEDTRESRYTKPDPGTGQTSVPDHHVAETR